MALQKAFLSFLLGSLIRITGCLLPVLSANAVYSQDIRAISWVKENFSKGKQPPFRFTYEGKNSRDFITKWKYSSKKIVAADTGRIEFLYTYRDQRTGMEANCYVSIFPAFNTVEWILKFSNTAGVNSSIIEKADALDYSFTTRQSGSFILHHARGSNAARRDFMPVADTLSPEREKISMIPEGGRSSDDTGFPFFNIESPGQSGVMMAIGWTGMWSASFQQKTTAAIALRAGMEKMKLILYPGEEIRTPKICLLFWKGKDRMTGHNTFRRFILAHHSPKINGSLPDFPLSALLARGGPAPCNEHTCATEIQAISQIRRQQQFNIVPDVFWMDAGWYSTRGEWWQQLGDYTPDTSRFPNGFKPVSDVVHEAGAKYLLWFEPERIYPGTMIAEKHPEKTTYLPGRKASLFNMGDEKARLWMTDLLSDFIKKEGVDYYRQDFNMKPMDYWQKMDAPDRVGIAEIRHITGLYAFWDSLLVRFPGLVIDNCSSGGRRIDLESISRSAPFWRSDYEYGEPNGYQCHTYGINFYLPLSGAGNIVTTPYGFRSSMGSIIATIWDINNSAGKLAEFQKCIADFKRLRQYYYYSDYYPLTGTEKMLGDDVWLSYQLNRPDKNDGIIMAFRRIDCPVESITVKLRGMEENASYEWYDEDTNTKIIKTGKELMNGIPLILKEKPGSLLIMYKKIR